MTYLRRLLFHGDKQISFMVGKHMAEDFLFIGRGFRRMSRTVEVGPRPVNKKSFVLNRSAGGRFYGH
jgi:hypothetical protein